MSIWECTFANPVTMGTRFAQSGQWWQEINGMQALPGALVAGHPAGFQFNLGQAFAPNPDLYISNTIIPSVSGSNGPVMFQSVLQANTGDPTGDCRSNYFFDQDFETYGDEWIQTSRVFMQADLLDAMVPTGGFTYNFRQLWECKVGAVGVDPTLRYGFGLEWKNSWTNPVSGPGMRWVAGGSIEPGSISIFDDDVDTPAVIAGAWFDFEVYVRFHQTTGQFRVSINGATVFDFNGVQTLDRPLAQTASRWKLASLYTAVDRMPRPHFQYVDSISLSVPVSQGSSGAATSGSRKRASIVQAVRTSAASRGRTRLATAKAARAASTSRGWRRASDAVSR